MTPAEHLRAARALLTPEGAWTQGSAARDSTGSAVDPISSSAECWCLFGAVSRFGSSTKAWGALIAIIRTPIPFNDAYGRKQAEVLAVLDKAIELTEAQS